MKSVTWIDGLIYILNHAAVPAATVLVLVVSGRSYDGVGWWYLVVALVLGLYVVVRYTGSTYDYKTVIAGGVAGVLVGVMVPISNINSGYQPDFGSDIKLEAEIVADPEYRGAYQRFVVSPVNFNGDKILVSTEPATVFRNGEVVLVAGTINPIENFVGDTDREFHYQGYLFVRGVTAVINYATVQRTGRSEPGLRPLLAQVKSHFLSVIAAHLPEPHSSLAGGITVGANDAMGEDVNDLFRRVGLTHIVVLSGYNVAIVILALSAALAFLPYWVATGVSMIGIWLFVLLVGVSATIVRAGIMASIAVVSRLYGSQVRALVMLAVAVIAMVLLEPLIVRYDPSFQLSVLATIGIIVVAPIIEPYFKWVSVKLGLREIIVTTLATQITVIPWIIYIIGDFSIVSPLANTLVLPAVPPAMGFVFATYVVSGISSVLTAVMTLVSYGLLEYKFMVSQWLGSWSHASLSIPPLSFGYVVIIYLLIAVLLMKLQHIHTINKKTT